MCKITAPFIDIHTHSEQLIPGTFRVWNYSVGQSPHLDNIICTAGIHPWHIEQNFTKQWNQFESIVKTTQVIGIGECGLDKLCSTDWDLQVDIFTQQVKLANTLNKPIIIHSVRAYQEITKHLTQQKIQTPVIFHGFNKKQELATSLLKKGYYLSLGADILHGKQDDLIAKIPITRLFLETDNQTTSIVDIFSYFCAARKISLTELKQQMVINFEQVFNYRIEE